MTRFVWTIRYVRWWRKVLADDWDRKSDTRLFFEWAQSWLDPDNWDAIGEALTPEDCAAEDASNA